jgi:hypothetical protein
MSIPTAATQLPATRTPIRVGGVGILDRPDDKGRGLALRGGHYLNQDANTLLTTGVTVNLTSQSGPKASG